MSVTADVDGLDARRFDSEQERAALRLQDRPGSLPKKKYNTLAGDGDRRRIKMKSHGRCHLPPKAKKAI